jgi:O-antigen ligase
MPYFVATSFWLFVIWLIRRDTALRPGMSAAVWIPTLWVGILASRPISMWVGFGGGVDTLEGSPVDRAIFIALIGSAAYILTKRGLEWGIIISDNWPIFLFYGYLFISIFWADAVYVSFKRWLKEIGNIVVALVILTEVDWQQAFRAVFVRCAYVLMPLSVIYIRYFPDLGRRYSMHSGGMEATGVTTQKNSLGTMVVTCGLILIWDWLERSRPEADRQDKWERYVPIVVLGIGVYLLHVCDSKTSIACLIVGSALLAATRLPVFRQKISALGITALISGVVLFALDSVFDLKAMVVQSMGRDMTFTGRTDVWRELLNLKTDPIFGTGFCSFWSNQYYQSKLPEWLAEGRSTHNGYLEMYIDGGWVALFFLAIMLIAIAIRINRDLGTGSNYAVVRFAVFVAMLIGNFSESHFGRMSPLGFLFLLVAMGSVPPDALPETWTEPAEVDDEVESAPGEASEVPVT